jgi:hypothetical protein
VPGLPDEEDEAALWVSLNRLKLCLLDSSLRARAAALSKLIGLLDEPLWLELRLESEPEELLQLLLDQREPPELEE